MTASRTRARQPPSTERRSTARPTCLVVSHSYLEPEIARSLDALDAHLSVCLVTPRTSPVLVFASKSADRLGGARYDVVGFRRFPRSGVLYVLASVRLGLERKPDFVIVEYDPWAPLFWQVALARRLFAPRTLIYLAVKKNTFRSRPRLRAAVKRRLARAGLRQVAGVFASSCMTAELYRREFSVSPQDLAVIPVHPVDTGTFWPAPRAGEGRPFIVGFVGRIDSRKGVDVLVHAVERLRADGLRLVLHTVGPVGDLGAEVERATKAGILRAHPPIPNSAVAQFLRTLDAFVMPSARLPDHEEHDGRALLEAMATGLPCVGSDSGVIPEILDHGRGRVFAAGDVEALADQLRVLVSDAGQRRAMGERGRRYVQERASTDAVALARYRAMTVGAVEAEPGR